MATLRRKANKEAMSQLTLNPLQEVNLPAKPRIHNGTQDRYRGLDVFYWKRKKELFILILEGVGGEIRYETGKPKEREIRRT